MPPQYQQCPALPFRSLSPPDLDPNATAADLLAGNLPLALKRKREALLLPFDPDNPRQNRLVIDTAIATLNAAVKVDENRLMAERQPEALERVLARILEYQAAHAKEPGGGTAACP